MRAVRGKTIQKVMDISSNFLVRVFIQIHTEETLEELKTLWYTSR